MKDNIKIGVYEGKDESNLVITSDKETLDKIIGTIELNFLDKTIKVTNI